MLVGTLASFTVTLSVLLGQEQVGEGASNVDAGNAPRGHRLFLTNGVVENPASRALTR
jgi:hypothetical protein